MLSWRRILNMIIGPLVTLILIGYFAYHVIQGDRGLLSWIQLRKDLHDAQNVHSALEHHQKELEIRTKLLNPGSLDRDMLEERAQSVLHMIHPDSLVIYENEN